MANGKSNAPVKTGTAQSVISAAEDVSSFLEQVKRMRACSVDINILRRNLESYIDNELANLIVDNVKESKPTAGFQRVIQRAVIHGRRFAGTRERS